MKDMLVQCKSALEVALENEKNKTDKVLWPNISEIEEINPEED